MVIFSHCRWGQRSEGADYCKDSSFEWMRKALRVLSRRVTWCHLCFKGFAVAAVRTDLEVRGTSGSGETSTEAIAKIGRTWWMFGPGWWWRKWWDPDAGYIFINKASWVCWWIGCGLLDRLYTSLFVWDNSSLYNEWHGPPGDEKKKEIKNGSSFFAWATGRIAVPEELGRMRGGIRSPVWIFISCLEDTKCLVSTRMSWVGGGSSRIRSETEIGSWVLLDQRKHEARGWGNRITAMRKALGTLVCWGVKMQQREEQERAAIEPQGTCRLWGLAPFQRCFLSPAGCLLFALNENLS